MNQETVAERQKPVITKRVVKERPPANNILKRKENIKTIMSNITITNKIVKIEENFFNNIDQIIINIKELTSKINIQSYLQNSTNYNSSDSIQLLFNRFIKDIKAIEVKNQDLEEYKDKINTKITEINTKLGDLDKVVVDLSKVGNKGSNKNVRNAIREVKPIIDNNKRLLIQLTEYKKKVDTEYEDSETAILNLKSDFKEELYNKIINHYNKLITNSPPLNISSNNIIPNLIKLSEIIKDGESYLQIINKNIKLNLGNNNYDIEANILDGINKKIKVISDRLNELKVSMTSAIKKLKEKTIADIMGIKSSIKTKTEELIKAIRECISKIKTNKNTGLEKIKSELKVLEDKFNYGLLSNFKNLFKNNNVVALEKNLNKKLNDIKKILGENISNKGKNNISLSETVLPTVSQILGREPNNKTVVQDTKKIIERGKYISWKTESGAIQTARIISHNNNTKRYKVNNSRLKGSYKRTTLNKKESTIANNKVHEIEYKNALKENTY